MSESDVIMSIQEIIDASFRVDNKCVVNFKLLKTLLLILGNQLRILDRNVLINTDDINMVSNISVSEMTVQVSDKKKKKAGKTSSKSESYLKNQDNTEEGRIDLEADECRSAPHIDILTEEEKRERELRIIEQRNDSRMDPAKTPTPMTSLDSLCRAKILLVGAQGRAPRLSVVTKDEFDKVYGIVRELQAQLDPKGILNSNNADLIKSLRQGASLPDAIAALSTSARLQAFDKALGITFSLMTELAKNTNGVDIAQFKAVETEFKAKGEVDDSVMLIKTTDAQETSQMAKVKDYVTVTELQHAMKELYEGISETVQHISHTTKIEISKTVKTIADMENKMEKASEIVQQFQDLEKTVVDYGKRISALDTNLSTQITRYQDELTQMQNELERGLDTLEQNLANMATNPDDIAEISRNLSTVQDLMENSSVKQKDLEIFQTKMARDMEELYEQLELIRECKADRSEVKDSLSDKAGIEQLNGMVSIDILNACRDDLLNRIQATNDAFNHQQEVWQIAIDDLVGKIDDKCDWHQLYALRDDIGRHLNDLQRKINDLTELIGEPRAVALNKILFRDTECLSCRHPARMEITVPTLPLLPSWRRASADGAEATKQLKGDGDGKTCYVDHPVKHPMKTKKHMCHRYCGGSHTILPAGCPTGRAVALPTLQRELTETIGTDGFTYKTDVIVAPTACIPCNTPATTPKKKDEPESYRFDPENHSGQLLSLMDLWNA